MIENNRALRVTVLHNGTHTAFRLRALPGQVLMPGICRNASRMTDPFLDFAVDASTCNNSGEFEVLEAVYAVNLSGFAGYSGTIVRFRATFRQSRTRASPNDSITGEVRLVDLPMG